MTELADRYAAVHRGVCLPVVRIRAEHVGGSGTVIWSRAKGGSHSTYVLTNHHVIDDLIRVESYWDPILQREAKRDMRGLAEAHFFNYRWESRAVGTQAVEADVVAYNPDEDLALLHLRSDHEVPAGAKLYPRDKETDLRVGMPVYAVGAGMGEPPVLTSGFLSQFGREIDHKEFWLNTAPAIFGNSGGALFLADTLELIGVPARIAVAMLGFAPSAITHLAFAIPITRVYEFLENQCFRFIYDDSFTEEGEEAERRRRREEDRRRTAAEESRDTSAATI